MTSRLQLQWILRLVLIPWELWIVAVLPLLASPSPIPSDTIVISQIYGAGGNIDATYQNDFIELFNRGTTTIALNGWSVQYASGSGSSWSRTNLAGSIAPGQYFLIKQGSGGSNGSPLPTADVTGTIDFSASGGKIALVNNTTTFTTTCPFTSTNPVDFVGYGSSTNCFEGTAPAPVSSNSTHSTQRLAFGCTETDSNTSDFSTATVYPRNTSSPTFSCALPAANLLITEVLYDGIQTDEGDEFIEITNPPTYTVNLTGYKIGDEGTRGGGEGMYEFPPGTTIAPNAVLIIARNAAQFRARFGFDPHYELVTTGALTDTLSVPNLDKYTAWAGGSFYLSNSGDEVLLLAPGDIIMDSVAWGSGDFAAAGLHQCCTLSAPEPQSLQRYGTRDTNNMSLDFLRDPPSPGALRTPPTPPMPMPGAAMPDGLFAYWGDIHAHSTASDGDGPPRMAFDTARAHGLHFFALADHDAWLDAEEWSEIGNVAHDTTVDGVFIGLRGFEWSHPSKGHSNVYNSTTWVSHDVSGYDTLAGFYAWLAAQPNVVAQFNHPAVPPGAFDNFAFNAAASDKIALIEIGNNGDDQYKTYEPQYRQALNQRWHVAPEIGSDHHGLVWGNDSLHRTGIIAAALTTTNVLDALRARRVFATEDANLALALQSNGVWMGATITATPTINFTITARDPDPEPITLELYDNGALVATQAFSNSNVTWNIAATGYGSHYYYVRATQSDGDIAYTAPIWTSASEFHYLLPFIGVSSPPSKRPR